MRDPRARLHRPVEALRRIQDLAGILGLVDSDRNANRAAQVKAVQELIFETAVAALNGGPLPDYTADEIRRRI